MSADQPTLQDRIDALRARYDELRESVGMTDVAAQLGDVATDIAGLSGEIAALRERGYAFAGYLEQKANVLREQWEEVSDTVRAATEEEIDYARQKFEEIGALWSSLENQWSDKLKAQRVGQIEREQGDLAALLEAARGRIDGMYGRVPENVAQTRHQIAQIKGYLALADEATVDWTPTEALVLAVKAEWVKSGKGKQDPDGILFLTDQRLIFEQKEKVGGRFGFGGEKVQAELWAMPVGSIQEARAEDKGLFGGKDMVHLTLSAGDYAEMTLEVKGGVDCKWYVQQLNRVVSGEIEKERALPLDASAAEAIRDAPTACPTCGATLPPVVRGMSEIACEYCGTVVRI